MKTKIICLITSITILLFVVETKAQTIGGTVFEMDAKNSKNPLAGVNIYWLGTTNGTISDASGKFEISRKGVNSSKLVFSFLGYKTDTVHISPGSNSIEVMLASGSTKLNEIVIKNQDNGSYNSRTNLRKVQIITSGELQRAACCNLAESFETNASVDVAYSDAITGAKQIQLLGLSGVYSQIISENVPLIHGLASSFGLNYIPGSWMESIQVSKGTSSVINGYESTTGQINVEFKKPASSEKLFVNLFANSKGRLEANVNSSYKFNKKLSTMILGHVDDFRNKFDRNNDKFMDVPQVTTVNLFNRWDYMVPNKYVSRFGIKYLSEDRNGGFMNYSKDTYTQDTTGISNRTKSYGIAINTRRTEAFWKNGLMFPNKPYKSLALIVSGIYHDQSGLFGLNTYRGIEKSFFSTLLYQSLIGNENHKFTTGLSYSNSDYTENYNRTNFEYLYQTTGNTADLFKLVDYSKVGYTMNRTESVYGAFFEYTFHYRNILSVIGGIRADHHNQFGSFVTPRLNVKYNINETLTLRGSAGKGYRTANIFSENYSLMASQRLLNFVEPLKQEEAWNFGLNLNKEFKLFGNKAEIDLEGYRTNFKNQVIVDMDSLPQSVFFYNLKGKSFSNCFQVQLTVEPVKQFSVLLALRSNTVKTTIGGKLREKPFVTAFKGLVTLQYSTKFEIWKFDITGQLNGPARIPDQQKMPEKIQRDYSHSPTFFNLLAQVTKKFKHFDVYLGGENLTDVTQEDPITESKAPYHTHFDTSMVWGPLVGTTVYAGVRFTIK
jgi:hypothetical protein